MAERRNDNEKWGVPERIAAWAAGTGFGLSALMMLAYQDASIGAGGGIELRSALETAFVLLWPSAILLKGAHTAQGGTILFLISAALNAGYFIFVSLGAYLLYGKMETMFPATAPNAVPLRAYVSPRVMRRNGATQPQA